MTYSARAVVRKLVLTAGAAALLLGAGALKTRVRAAAVDAFLKIEGLDGGSKDPAHMNWIQVQSVPMAAVADLDGDGMADREASVPSVSEMRKAGGDPSSANIGSQSSGAGAGKAKVQGMNAAGSTAVRESPTMASQGKTMASDDWSAKSVQSPRDVATGQAGGKRMHKPLTITKEVDKSSPRLMKMMQSGQTIRQMEVDLGRPTQHNPTGRFMLENVMISSIQRAGGGGGGGAMPMESITFTYQKIEMK